MGNKEIAADVLAGAGKLSVWAAKKLFSGAKSTCEYIHDHREQINHAAKLGTLATGHAIKAMGNTIYDAASLKMYPKGDIHRFQKKIEQQGREYRQLTSKKLDKHRMVDSLAVGGDQLHNVLVNGASPEVKAAYVAAWPDKAQHMSFEDAVRSTSDAKLPALVSAVKGKLFELKYAEYLNDGHLPAGYTAELAHAANQPGWDIAIHGPDNHVASLLQLKATDSVEYVKHALERYPDIHVVSTDEVYSKLVMNGAADHVIDSGMSNGHISQMVTDSVDHSAIHMHWDLPVVSLAMIAFTTYSLADADAYKKACYFGERSGKSYLCYLVGGGVACITQTWWLGLFAGIGSRFLASRGRHLRELYAESQRLIRANEVVLRRLRNA